MDRYYLAAYVAVALTAVSQLLLKLGAMHGKNNGSLLGSYLNTRTLTGYALLLVVTFLNVYAYTRIDLKIAVVLVPMTFILVAVLSFTVLKERFTKNNFVGAAIILAGIVVFNV